MVPVNPEHWSKQLLKYAASVLYLKRSVGIEANFVHLEKQPVKLVACVLYMNRSVGIYSNCT